MRLLLDTCTFLWVISDPERIPAGTINLIRRAESDCYLSASSLWEIIIKRAKGGIEIDTDSMTATAFLVSQREAHRIAPLPIEEEVFAHLEHLPPLHGDPFDRLLICQAIEQGLTLVTPDRHIRRYPIKTLWD